MGADLLGERGVTDESCDETSLGRSSLVDAAYPRQARNGCCAAAEGRQGEKVLAIYDEQEFQASVGRTPNVPSPKMRMVVGSKQGHEGEPHADGKSPRRR